MNGKTVHGSWGRGTSAKPLKRLGAARRRYTALKRGVNERSAGSHMFTFVRICADNWEESLGTNPGGSSRI